MIMVYLTDIPSAFVMHHLRCRSSPVCGKLGDCIHYDVHVLARHKIVHAHLFKGLKDTRREEFTIKQNGPDVAAHTAAYCNQDRAQNQAHPQGPMCRTPSTRRGPPSTHCAVISLSNVLVLLFLLDAHQVDAGFFVPSRDQVHIYCNCHYLVCNLPKLVHCIKMYTRTELAKSFIISVLSVLERIPLNHSSVGTVL